jgi:hypothetical protein
VPLQGHWQRVNTPLRKTTSRERRILLVVAAVLAVTVIAGTIVAIGSSSKGTPAGCIHLEVGSTMGGSRTQLCGRTAQSFCRGPVAHADQGYLGKCREAGISVTPE